jgi:hypothetical protein
MSSNIPVIATQCRVAGCRFKHSHVTAGHMCGICKNFGHGQIECPNQTAKGNLLWYDNEILPEHLYCTRPKCQYNKLHTTSAHICTICGRFHSGFNCPSSPEFEIRRRNELMNYCNSNRTQAMCTIKCPTCRDTSTFKIEDSKLFGIEMNCTICCSNKIDTRIPCGHVFCLECVQKMNEFQNQTNLQMMGPESSYDELYQYFYSKFSGIDGKVCHAVNAGMGCWWFLRRDNVGELIEIWFSHSDDHYNQAMVTATDNFVSGYRII